MVTLIGAGPGDGELITLKGARRLREAEVVLYDRLLGEGILSMIPETAQMIDVGKNAGRHPVPQDEINALILEKARLGKNVVRLKGGDPFVFGRGGEELMLLAENGLEFEVVPGITSAIAAGAYAGIPITHREYASSLHIITGHAKENGELCIDYEALVRLGGTLVFLMSVSSLERICEGLLNAGMDTATAAAVIENGTQASQRKLVGTVGTLAGLARANNISSPAVVIVGAVCGLSDKLDWFTHRPLSGKRVMVTRAREGASALAERLRDLGCDVVEAPCVRIVPLTEDNAALEAAVDSLSDYGWLVFTSGTGVRLFFEYLAAAGYDTRRLSGTKIAAIGAQTGDELQKRGIFADYLPKEYNGRALALGLLPHIDGRAVLLARARLGTGEIPEILAHNGVVCDSVSLYDTVFEDSSTERASALLASRRIDCVMFTSSSAVHGFMRAFSDIKPECVRALCIGGKTAETARGYGIETAVSDAATLASMVEKLKEMVGNDGH